MRSGCDTTTPQALENEHTVFALNSEVQADKWADEAAWSQILACAQGCCLRQKKLAFQSKGCCSTCWFLACESVMDNKGRSTCGLVAMTSASHAEGRQFDPGQVYIPYGLWQGSCVSSKHALQMQGKRQARSAAQCGHLCGRPKSSCKELETQRGF